MTSRAAVRLLLAAAVLLFAYLSDAFALEWITIAPNPAYSRDLAMGSSTVALSCAPQSMSTNPAGLTLFDPRDDFHASLILNPGGLWQLSNYARSEAANRGTAAQIGDGARLLVSGAALQLRIFSLAAMMSQPVMDQGDTARYRRFARRSSLDYHQNSLLIAWSLHPRVSVGGRLDRYYRYDLPQATGYSYGVILRPRGVNVGVEYQRFPASGIRVWHPLDRRGDQSTSAGIAILRANFTATFQFMNLTQSDQPAFLEPHAGMEWRPFRFLALRAGGVQFSRSANWAWTTGIGLLDANWLRSKAARLLVPDEVLQLAVAVIYHRRVPQLGISSLTCAWRF